MSQMHSHGPGQPMHSHGPTPAQQPQQVVTPNPDPALQAVIDASFKPVSFKLGPPNDSQVLCSNHSLEKCADCDVDFGGVNVLAKLLAMLPPEAPIPPPPNMAGPQRGQLVTKTKEDGNTLYKTNKFQQAVHAYSVALNISLSRPPWEPAASSREEVVVLLSNRSAALAALGEHAGSLVDAEMVILLKRPWSKGHLRKGKALLALGRPEEAQEAVRLGLSHEPQNAELLSLLLEAEEMVGKKTLKHGTIPSSPSKSASASTDNLLT